VRLPAELLGGLGGWLVGIGALAIPGIGPFIAAGAFATALGGAAIGAGLGAIAGALAGMGVPEEHAKYYEGEAKGWQNAGDRPCQTAATRTLSGSCVITARMTLSPRQDPRRNWESGAAQRECRPAASPCRSGNKCNSTRRS